MKLKRCENQHLYPTREYAECPFCAGLIDEKNANTIFERKSVEREPVKRLPPPKIDMTGEIKGRLHYSIIYIIVLFILVGTVFFSDTVFAKIGLLILSVPIIAALLYELIPNKKYKTKKIIEEFSIIYTFIVFVILELYLGHLVGD